MLHRPIAAIASQAAPARPTHWTARHFHALLATIWLATAIILVVVHAAAIAGRSYGDSDDFLRLVEVRDWLAGQSFWDVSQQRVNMPFGGPMHWSRIVDAPIALVELLLRPLLGAGGAETAAAVIVPMLTLGVAMAAIGRIGRRLAEPPAGLVAAALAPLATATLVQFAPLRVDHHGWEIAFSLIALAGILAGGRRGGLVAGLAIAVGLQISLEQLPFAVALGATIAGRWMFDPGRERGACLLGFAAALAAVETLLFVTLHAPTDWGVHCDAVSPPHLLAMVIVAAGIAVSIGVAPAGMAWRAAGLAATAAVAAFAAHAVPPQCGLSPFSALGPLEKTVWLDHVAEGLPVWRSGLTTAIAVTGFPLVGLVACGFAANAERGERRALWLSLGAVLAAATLVGILVLRAASLSNAIATVPAAWAMIRLLRRSQATGSAATRILGTVAVVLALQPLAPAVVAVSLPFSGTPDDAKAEKDAAACRDAATWRALDGLSPARIMAPIDLGPALLFDTPHAVLATPHHRNHVAIADEIRVWIGDDAAARRILRAHGIGYVLVCPALGEAGVYAKLAPRGLSARLVAGRAPAWLVPVPMPGSAARLWRIVPQPPAGSPSSRSAGGAVPTAAQISRSADLMPSS